MLDTTWNKTKQKLSALLQILKKRVYRNAEVQFLSESITLIFT